MLIRHSSIQDIPSIKAIYEQESSYAQTLQLPFPAIEKWLTKLDHENPNFYSLVADDEGQILGQIGMQVFDSPRRKHVANIGMAVSEHCRGKGVASEMLAAMIKLAHNWVAVTRIELEVYTDNAAAIALYEKFGFEIEGTAKQYAFRDGQYVDAYLMAKLS